MQAYLELAEFCKLVHLNEDVVKGMMAKGTLKFKEEEGKIYIEANQGTFSIVRHDPDKKELVSSMSLAGESFVEKTIGTILNLHEKVLDAKDETLDALKSENRFLKDALVSMQELYDADRSTIATLNEELRHAREEIEFLKRKYKLMWGRTTQALGSRAEPDLELRPGDTGAGAVSGANSGAAASQNSAGVGGASGGSATFASGTAAGALSGVATFSGSANFGGGASGSAASQAGTANSSSGAEGQG